MNGNGRSWHHAQCGRAVRADREAYMCTSVSPSATPTMQSKDRCRQVPRLPRQQPRRQRRQLGTKRPTRPRTTLTHSTLPKPHARRTSNTNFRVSACHGYPERRLHTAPATRKPAAAQRRPRAQQPGGSVYYACHTKARLPHKSRPRPSGGTRAAAPPEDSVYCACHTKASGGHACSSSSRRLCVLRLPHGRGPAAARAHQLLQKDLCTAPATRKPAAASGGHTRSTSSRRICVLRLPHESQRRPRAQQLLQKALCIAPATRKPAAAQRRPRAAQQKALCTAPATRKPAYYVYFALPHKSQPRPSGSHARSSSSRRLCVLRLPHDESQPRPSQPRPIKALCTAPATRKPAAASQPRPSGGHARSSARSSSSGRLCVLRLPHESQPRRSQPGPAAATHTAAPPEGSVYCACHTKGSRGPASRGPLRLCVLRLPHESQPRPASRAPAAATRAAAPPEGSVYCACHTKASRGAASRGPAAATRAAAPPEASVCCACSSRRLCTCVLRLPHESQPRRRQPRPSGGCHTKGSRGPASRGPLRLCVLRLPHESQPRPASRAPACVLRLPHESQPRRSQPRSSGGHARSSSSRRLCVLRLLLQKALHMCTAPATRKPAAAQRWPRAQQLLQKALSTAPATGYEMSEVSDEYCVMS